MQVLTSYRRSGKGVTDPGDRGERSPVVRARVFAAAVLGPIVAGYVVVAALFGLVTAMAAAGEFSIGGVLRAAGPGWLAAYQVPVEIAGRPLGVLPLLATIGALALVARSAATATQRLGYAEPGATVPLIAAVTSAHALAGLGIALFDDGAGVRVEPLSAFAVPAVLAGVAAAAGAASRSGVAAAVRDYLDPLAVRGLRAGALGLAGLLAVGALVHTVGLVLASGTIRQLFAANAPGFGSGAGMLLLSLGYLPNAVVGGLAFVTGPGFSIGSFSASAFSFTGGPVPGLPVLAGVPEHAAPWWPVLMLLPAGVGALLGWSLRRADENPLARLRIVAIAGALVGFGCVLLGTLAGGRLGGGAFDPVTIPVGLVSVAAFGWIAVPGGLIAWFAGPHARPKPAPEPEEPQVETEIEAELENLDAELEELEAEAEESAEEPAEEDPEEDTEGEPEDEPDDGEERPPTNGKPDEPS
ncbi:cell division protein PerM [Amycolatopsis tucumanensis]|uniref:cell division protein PerM n=1 Tax=Amycolatopsis tucumanensis TaxID=401106 RepID=UPI003D728A76